MLLGIDVGSSSVKASIVNSKTGDIIAADFFPKVEMHIKSVKPGWAEQNVELWWSNLVLSVKSVIVKSSAKPEDIIGIGISYQMHGLVLLDKDLKPIRDSIIWCDSRAVPYGEKAFNELGHEQCLSHVLNTPGNFTLCKLKWVKENEPENYAKVKYYLLPGDYIAFRLTGIVCTTLSGISEGIAWDFTTNTPAKFLFDYLGISEDLIPPVAPTFGIQGKVLPEIAAELGLAAGTPVAYRAGDQPNNALSLNVLNPGEIAATAGTSGVVYGINDTAKYDPPSRLNSFAHVNYTPELTRVGVMLCINGTAILYAWIKNNVAPEGISYKDMDKLAESIPIGSEGLIVIPFGNGAERVLSNKQPNCSIHGINFLIHKKAHLIRASLEGCVFSFKYGIDIFNELGIETKTIRAGFANLFLSSVFGQTLANITGATIELYNTDGSAGAARGAGIGIGIYKTPSEAFTTLKKVKVIIPIPEEIEASLAAYNVWKQKLLVNLTL